VSLELVRQEIRKFIRSSGNEVLLLRGRWGIGKTFFWQRLVEEAASERSLGCDNYAYVSLFGVTYFEALKSANISLSDEGFENCRWPRKHCI
jgi:tRNA A37 threonylcarbamoyladenosine biosynthesis protein TsaE